MNKAKRKKNIVGLKELRENMEEYISRVDKGESFTVVRRSEPVFQISAVNEDDARLWETVVDFTEIDSEGVSAKDIVASLKKGNE